MSEPLRVACLTAYQPLLVASTRYRIGQYIPILAQHNIHTDIIPFASRQLQTILYQPGRKFAKVIALLGSVMQWLPQVVRKADVVFVQREAALVGPPLMERWLRRRCPVIFDFDDAVFLAQTNGVNGKLGHWARPANKTAMLIRLSDLTLAGNTYLASYAQRFSSNVQIVPTTVDCRLVQPRIIHSDQKVVTLGWIGTNATAWYLNQIIPALEVLAEKHPFRLLIIGSNQSFQVAGAECINRTWNLEREVADLQDMDIGLYPVPDNEWSLGKCALKALQYGAVGIPTVCTPIGMNADVVQDGITGFYATSVAEWLARLAELIADPALRQRLGAAARTHVVEHYAHTNYGGTIADAIRTVFEQRR